MDQEVNVTALDLSAALAQRDRFDFVGVTFHSFSVKYARLIRNYFKKRLICGGHHPSALPKQMLSLGYDQVVIGEGENAILDIIHGNNDCIVKGSDRWYKSIDDIPFPDYTGLKFTDNVVISSRGCPFKCNFCASSLFWENSWKSRNPENVINEVSKLNSWMFEDDNFTANKKRAIEICRGIKGSWQCASRAENLDDELCEALKASGCHTVWLGVESFSQASLDRCNKHTTVEKMIKGIEIAEKHGIQTMSQFIVGLPGDTIEDIRETARVIRQTKMTRFGANIAWILPNTEIHTQAKLRGFNDDEYLISGAPFYTYENPLVTLQHWANIINNAKA